MSQHEFTSGDCRSLKAKLKVALETQNAQEIDEILTILENAEMTRQILVSTDKERLARVKRLRNTWKLLFNPTTQTQELSPNALHGPNAGHSANQNHNSTNNIPSALPNNPIAMQPTLLVRKFPPRTESSTSPAPTNSFSLYDLNRRWQGVDGCPGEDGTWHSWSRSILRAPTDDINTADFAGPYTLPF